MSTLAPSFVAARAERATALRRWQRMHTLLASGGAAEPPQAKLADFAVYYHCVHQAFDQPADEALAQRLAQQLVRQPWPAPDAPWSTYQVDQASALAWLSAHRAAGGLPAFCAPERLAALDKALYQAVRDLPDPSAPLRRSLLVGVGRYLRLRLPDPAAAYYLNALVAHWPEWPPQGAEAAPALSLGLADGLAAELFVLLRAHRAGVRHPNIEARVRQGLQRLLRLRRDVDFLAGQYSVFPYQARASTLEGEFSSELSWRCGDAGQSWLLYEAQAILQDQELAKIAELVGLNTLLRTDVAATNVREAGFYQGAAGVAQLYRQLYCASGLPAFRTASHHWLDRTHDLLTAPLAAAQAEQKLLGGLTGVSMVLLSAATENIPDWSSLLV